MKRLHKQCTDLLENMSGRIVNDKGTSLAALGIANSISLWKLHAALERLVNKSVSAINKNMTVAQLLAHFGVGNFDSENQDSENISAARDNGTADTLVNQSDLFESAIADTETGFRTLGIGVDIEEIAQFPHVNDFRDDTFYRATFTEKEISQAILHESPRSHFCGLFCAKEALKKSRVEFLQLRFTDVEIISLSGDAPRIYFTKQQSFDDLHIFCSISHTRLFANAFVLVQANVMRAL